MTTSRYNNKWDQPIIEDSHLLNTTEQDDQAASASLQTNTQSSIPLLSKPISFFSHFPAIDSPIHPSVNQDHGSDILTHSFHTTYKLQKKEKTKQKIDEPEEEAFITRAFLENIKFVKNFSKIVSNPVDDYQPVLQQAQTTQEPSYYFFKKNPPDSLMSELEAVCFSFYELLAPEYVTKTRAHYKDIIDDYGNVHRCYVGVSSKAIHNFKSTMEDPLKSDDLYIESLATQQYDVEQLDYINDQLIENNIDIESIPDNKKIKGYGLSAKDIKNFRFIKGLAICLMMSYLFEEDDLHRGNKNKKGQRIDFDMSLWPILHLFKECNIINWFYRYPTEHTFELTQARLKNLSDIKDGPFYWPGKQASTSMIPPNILAKLIKIFPVSKNAYSNDENTIYKLLINHPVFDYFKFQTLLKYVLTDSKMYKNQASLHMRNDLEYKGQNIIDMIVKHEEVRIDQATQVSVNMSEFQNFMKRHGKKSFRKIENDFINFNKKINKKSLKNLAYQEHLIDIKNIEARYKIIEKIIKRKSIKTFDHKIFRFFGQADQSKQIQGLTKVSPPSKK